MDSLIETAAPFTRQRLAMLVNGYSPVPVRTGEKGPRVPDWRGVAERATADDVALWATRHPDHGSTGILCGRVIGLDLDVLDPAQVFELEFAAMEALGMTPLRRTGREPKTMLVYRAAGSGITKVSTPALRLPDGSKAQVEILATGQQFVAFGTHPDTGKPYSWAGVTPEDVPLASLPEVTAERLAGFLATAENILRAAGGTDSGKRKKSTAATSGSAPTPSGDKARGFAAPPHEAKVVELLNLLPNPPEADRETYSSVMTGAVACTIALGGDPRDPDSPIAAAAIEWAQRYEAHDDTTDERQKWVDDWSKRTRQLAGWQTLLAVSRQLIPGSALEFESLPPGPVDPDGWRSMLRLNDKGTPRGGIPNALLALRYAPAWQGVVALDEFACKLLLTRRPPWEPGKGVFQPREIRDDDFTRIVEWLADCGVAVNPAQARDAATVIGQDNAFHSARDWLNDLRWDGEPRLDTWLMEYLGARDSALHRAYAAKFLLAAVARIRKPGCQVDTVLTLEGAQGIGKSTALRALAGDDWFTDHIPDLHNKDAAMQIQGKLIIEHAELDTLGRVDASRAKAFITTPVDRFRPPYGKSTLDFRRQCVFAATVNPGGTGYLKDETGNRRFWPEPCGVDWQPGRKVNRAALAAVRAQLWAEAAARHARGEVWHLDSAELERAQADAAEERLDVDVWTDTIREIVADKPYVRTATVLSDFRLGIAVKDQTDSAQKRVGRVLRALGWMPTQRRIAGEKMRVFLPRQSIAAGAVPLALVAS